MDQRDLVTRATGGDHDAFTALAAGAIARLDAAARLILRDDELARDAVQDALVRAWRDLPGLRDPDRFAPGSGVLVANADGSRPIGVNGTPLDILACTPDGRSLVASVGGDFVAIDATTAAEPRVLVASTAFADPYDLGGATLCPDTRSSSRRRRTAAPPGHGLSCFTRWPRTSTPGASLPATAGDAA